MEGLLILVVTSSPGSSRFSIWRGRQCQSRHIEKREDLGDEPVTNNAKWRRRKVHFQELKSNKRL